MAIPDKWRPMFGREKARQAAGPLRTLDLTHAKTDAVYPWAPDTPYEPRQMEKGDEDYQVIRSDPMIWGKMEMRTAPLLRHFKATTKRDGSAAPDGSVPKHWARWYSDKSVWERKGLRRGGTVLIDISGSMSWAHDITAELIEAMPAMTIAAYSGQADYGMLTIIAKQGRIVAAGDEWRHGHGGGNTVDGPALEWLARQPRPRVWFSDGEVHGIGEGRDFYRDAARICRLGNIHRALKIADVKAILAGKPFKVLAPVPRE